MGDCAVFKAFSAQNCIFKTEIPKRWISQKGLSVI
jgi:hypothetical protein